MKRFGALFLILCLLAGMLCVSAFTDASETDGTSAEQTEQAEEIIPDPVQEEDAAQMDEAAQDTPAQETVVQEPAAATEDVAAVGTDGLGETDGQDNPVNADDPGNQDDIQPEGTFVSFRVTFSGGATGTVRYVWDNTQGKINTLTTEPRDDDMGGTYQEATIEVPAFCKALTVQASPGEGCRLDPNNCCVRVNGARVTAIDAGELSSDKGTILTLANYNGQPEFDIAFDVDGGSGDEPQPESAFVDFRLRFSNGASGTVSYKWDNEEEFTALETEERDDGVGGTYQGASLNVPEGKASITVKAEPAEGFYLNAQSCGVWVDGQSVGSIDTAALSAGTYTYTLVDGQRPEINIEFDNNDGTGGNDDPDNPDPPQNGPSIEFGADRRTEETLTVDNGIFTLSRDDAALGTVAVTLVDGDGRETAYTGGSARISLADVSSVKIVMTPASGLKAALITGGDTPEGALSGPVIDEAKSTYTYTAYPANFAASDSGQGFLAAAVWFGADEDDPYGVDFTAVIWDGDQVEVQSEHGTVGVSSVVIGEVTYTYKGGGKFENDGTETDLIEWYGYDKTSSAEEAGVRIYDAAFESEDTEVYISFVFKPDYGYQVAGIGTNENPTSLADSGFTASETISTFRFQVFQHNNPHFTVVFSESEDVTDVTGAQDVAAAAIANGQNATDSGNLKLSVSDMDSAKKTQLTEEYGSDAMYLDLKLDQIVSMGEEDRNWTESITSFQDPITITLDIGAQADRNYYIIRVLSDGTAERVAVTNNGDGTVSFETNHFSDYILVPEAAVDVEASVTGGAIPAADKDKVAIAAGTAWDDTLNIEGVTKVELVVADSGAAAATKAAMASVSGVTQAEGVEPIFLELTLKATTTGAAEPVTALQKAVTVTLPVPAITSAQKYTVVREHEGEYKVLPSAYDRTNSTLSFETDKFSTYALFTGAADDGEDAKEVFVDNTEDKSLSVVIGRVIVTDKNTGQRTTTEVYNNSAAVTYSNPRPDAVAAMIAEAESAAKSYAGEKGYTITVDCVTTESVPSKADGTLWDNPKLTVTRFSSATPITSPGRMGSAGGIR